MKRVFISYAREDRRLASRLCNDLRRLGADPWLDTERLRGGQDWEMTVRQALAESSHVVLLISRRSVSKRGYVQKEVRQALDILDEFPPGEIFVVPVRVDPTTPQQERLAKLQWIDIFESYDAGLLLIAESIGLPKSAPTDSSGPMVLCASNVRFAPRAIDACEKFEYSLESVTDFLITEYSRHRLAYNHSFSAVPLIFRNHLLLLSWDGSHLDIDTVLERERVFPDLEAWAELLKFYRQALHLPYRTGPAEGLLLHTEANRTLRAIEKVVVAATAVMNGPRGSSVSASMNSVALDPLLAEARSAVRDHNFGLAISRMEFILSSAHKLLLGHVPGSGPDLAAARQWKKKATRRGRRPGVLATAEICYAADHKLRVLVVDDVPMLTHAFRTILEGEGYAVTEANDGTEALKRLIENDFDVVLTDIVMPWLDGVSLASVAKKLASTKILILMSGYLGAADACRDGIFLQKPFEFEKLIGIIKTIEKEGARSVRRRDAPG